MTKIEERLASAKPHERVVGRLVGVSNREFPHYLITSSPHHRFFFLLTSHLITASSSYSPYSPTQLTQLTHL